jgi:hypothetical protein
VRKLQFTGKPHLHSHTSSSLLKTSEQHHPSAQHRNCIDSTCRLDKSRSQRIIWLLEELKLDYELKVYKRGTDWLAPKELKEIHPLGKSPVIGVQAPGAEKPVIIAESGAIVEYLCEHFGRSLIPQRYPEGKDGVIGAETEEWLRYRVGYAFLVISLSECRHSSVHYIWSTSIPICSIFANHMTVSDALHRG